MQLYLIKPADLRESTNIDFKELLSETELKRYAGIAREDDRWTYLLSRYFLRHLLRLKHPRLAVEFSEHKFGKPFIKAQPDIEFNISHSDTHLLVGISERGPVGVDVELLSQSCDQHLMIAKKYFHEAEYKSIAASHNSKFEFLQIWTAKEALYKALGVGLTKPLADTIFYFNQPTGILQIKHNLDCLSMNLLCFQHDDHCVTAVSLNQAYDFSVFSVSPKFTIHPLDYQVLCSLSQEMTPVNGGCSH